MNMHRSFSIPTSPSSLPAGDGPSPLVQAFLRAFDLYYKSLDGLDGDDRTEADRRYDDFAYGGARETIRHGIVNNFEEVAIAALISREAMDMIVEGHFQEDLTPPLLNELRSIRDTLDNLWRFADERGGSGARGFARHVGAADESDLVRWQRSGSD